MFDDVFDLADQGFVARRVRLNRAKFGLEILHDHGVNAGAVAKVFFGSVVLFGFHIGSQSNSGVVCVNTFLFIFYR